MKKYKVLSLFLVLLLALGLVTACKTKKPADQGAKIEETNVEETYTVKDMLDRDLVFDQVPEKVVAITPSDAENLFAIGAGESLVGRGTYVDYPEEALKATVVASGSDLNAEEVLALEPDLILMTDMAQTEEQVKTFTDAGVNVLMSKSSTIEDVYRAIEILGQAMKKETEAQKVIGEMKTAFEDLAKNAEDNKGKTVYFEISPLEYGLWSAGDGTFMNEIAEILGLENIFSDMEGWSEVSEEEVIARNPDYIVTISLGSGEGPNPVEEILGRPGWEEITGVKEEQVLNLVDDELSRPSPKLVDGAKALEEFVK